MGAGFGNPFNVYAWNMNVYKRCLYVGTFDLSVFVMGALQKDPSLIRFFLSVYAQGDPPWKQAGHPFFGDPIGYVDSRRELYLPRARLNAPSI